MFFENERPLAKQRAGTKRTPRCRDRRGIGSVRRRVRHEETTRSAIKAVHALKSARSVEFSPPLKNLKSRSAPRAPAYRIARLILPSGAHVKCVVKELSAKGAKVVIEGHLALPAHAKLEFALTGQALHATIIWQEEAEAGLEFVR